MKIVIIPNRLASSLFFRAWLSLIPVFSRSQSFQDLYIFPLSFSAFHIWKNSSSRRPTSTWKEIRCWFEDFSYVQHSFKNRLQDSKLLSLGNCGCLKLDYLFILFFKYLCSSKPVSFGFRLKQIGKLLVGNQLVLVFDWNKLASCS